MSNEDIEVTIDAENADQHTWELYSFQIFLSQQFERVQDMENPKKAELQKQKAMEAVTTAKQFNDLTIGKMKEQKEQKQEQMKKQKELEKEKEELKKILEEDEDELDEFEEGKIDDRIDEITNNS